MLNQDDIDVFESLKKQAMQSLPERNILPVVNQRLYLSKDGSWHVRFMMTGYSMGKPTMKDLLEQYVFAVSGVEPTNQQVEDAEPIILERLIESMRQAVSTLQVR